MKSGIRSLTVMSICNTADEILIVQRTRRCPPFPYECESYQVFHHVPEKYVHRRIFSVQRLIISKMAPM